MSAEYFSELSESSWLDISEYAGQAVNIRIGYHSEAAGRELRLSTYMLMIDELISRDGFEGETSP